MGEQKTGETRAVWDVIVVGSGMGGMVTAAALSRLGHKVLLLEQYSKLGGLTHSYSRSGFRWDAGIHYLSGVGPGDSNRGILDWLTDEPIAMAPVGAVYDTVHIGAAEPIQLSRPTEAQKLDLKERFPEESEGIDSWYDAIREGREAARSVVSARAMPRAFGAAMAWWNRRAIRDWCRRTTAEVVNEYTTDPVLAAAMTAQWGDFGGRPGTASFALHAMVVGSYLESGGWYPVGGASAIAEHLIPTITSAGGEVRAGVTVKTLVFEEDRVVGVETADGEEIRGGVVVSDIGARDTVDELLPKSVGDVEWVDEIRSFQPNICHFSLLLGFEGDVEAAGATKSSHWLYPTGKTDVVWSDAPDSEPPGMYVSFASLRDPAHDPGPDRKYAGEVLAWTDWSTVERWAGRPPTERGDEYTDFKARAEESLFKAFRSYFPRLAELVVFRELATPLTTEVITGHAKGAFYGLEVTPKRMLSDALRMKTPVKGLYLSGQDVVSPGVPGALWGGLLCAASIDPKVFPHLGG
jgi:all-trans-retinol 13,14-reductase